MYFCQLNSLHITIAVSMVRLSIWVTEWLGSSSGTTGPPSTSQSAHIILCPHIKLMQTRRLYSPCVCVCVCLCVHAHVHAVSCIWLFATPWTIYSPPGLTIHGISQARILESVAIFYSRGSSQPRDWNCISCIGKQILYHLGNLYVCYA